MEKLTDKKLTKRKGIFELKASACGVELFLYSSRWDVTKSKKMKKGKEDLAKEKPVVCGK